MTLTLESHTSGMPSLTMIRLSQRLKLLLEFSCCGGSSHLKQEARNVNRQEALPCVGVVHICRELNVTRFVSLTATLDDPPVQVIEHNTVWLQNVDGSFVVTHNVGIAALRRGGDVGNGGRSGKSHTFGEL